MEKRSSHNTIPSILLDFFPLHIVFDLIYNLSSFLFSYFPWFHSNYFCHLFGIFEVKLGEDTNKQLISSRESYDGDESFLLGHDLHKIIENLGIEPSFEGENEGKKRWGCNEICGIFEEEPSLDEVKEAFGVFDQNKDGFIDAWELQRVLCVLGLGQGKELKTCSMMISKFDGNNDGKIDFNDFVKLMLKSF
ncbi:hypothetical protein RND81_08G097700 [Saponaria officinalis]|uniref:EF-hand domain-containing protein n=1 Tax=Saponaria officinalis TaxID=3572 RepID=A0AAW1J5N6_SAPOF